MAVILNQDGSIMLPRKSIIRYQKLFWQEYVYFKQKRWQARMGT